MPRFRSFLEWAPRQGIARPATTAADGSATLKKVNEWNRTRRFSRSYLDDEGDPNLELDLDITGGVTQARVADFLRTCRVSFVTWCDEVVK